MNDINKAKILYLKYKIKESNEYIGNGTDALEEVSKYIKSGFDNLKAINTVEIRSQIEYNIYKKTEYPGGLWLSKQKYIYQIYATIIGVLDARYDSYNRMLNFEEERIFKNEDEINNYKENIKLILNKRNKIVNDYYDIISSDGLDIIKETIEEVPFYKQFVKLSDDMTTNYYSGNLQGEFMFSYLLGYNKSLFFCENELIEIYDDLINDYKKVTLQKEYHNRLVKKLVFKKED